MNRRPERFGDLLPGVLADLAATHTATNGEPPMTERVQLDPIDAQLRARLDDWVENALDPQSCAQALRRVLDVARDAEYASLRWQDQLPIPAWVPAVRHEIAESLGVPPEAGAA